MLILHAFKEALQSLENHTLRTLSMGFGVLWAIFVLVLLLSIGNGFDNGVSEAFAKYGRKTMLISKGKSGGTSHPIPLDMVTNLSRSFQAIEHISPILIHNGVIHYEKKQVHSSILGCDPSYALLAHLPIQAGRFFTPRDTLSTNNVCVIGIQVKEKLFGSTSAIGKYIFLGDIGLQVVGVLDTLDASFYRESDALLLTSNLFKKLLPKESHYVNAIRLTLLPTTADATVEEQFRAYFARHLHFDIKDKQGLHIFNLSKHASTFHDFFKNISIFNAVVGICLLITGIVSMNNMMLVTIRERQQEMAIRRVLGSRAIEIVTMILCETAIVTLLAGAVGFGAGFALIQLLNKWVVPLSKAYYLSRLTCPISFIFGGLGLMALASCLAGIVPAMRAVKIKPVETLGSK